MSKVCFITGKKVLFGNNVSHSNRKTKRKFLPNLHRLKFWINSEKRFIKLLVSKKGLRIINKFGIDYIIKKNKKKSVNNYGKKK